jgi:hypothetical protein
MILAGPLLNNALAPIVGDDATDDEGQWLLLSAPRTRLLVKENVNYFASEKSCGQNLHPEHQSNVGIATSQRGDHEGMHLAS